MDTGTDTGFRIRPATTTAELLAAAHLYDAPPRPGWADRFLAADGHLMLIAYVDGAPAGFVSGIEMLHPDKGTEMCLYELSVDEAHRRRGIGRALTEALAAEARGAAATTCGWAWSATTRRLSPPTARRARRTTGCSPC